METVKAIFSNYIENFQAGVRNGFLETSMDVFEDPMKRMLELLTAVETFYRDEDIFVDADIRKAELDICNWVLQIGVPVYEEYKEYFNFEYPTKVENPRKVIDAFWGIENM